MQASLTRMVADARRQLRPLCGCGGGGCGGGGHAVDNPTYWDSGGEPAAVPKLPKEGMSMLSPVGVLGAPLPPILPILDGLGGHVDGSRKNGRASQCHPVGPRSPRSPRSPTAALEGQVEAASRRAAATARRDSFDEALQPLVLTSEVFLVLPVRAPRWSRLARTAVLLVLMTLVTSLAARRMLRQGVSLTSSSPVAFYGTALLAAYLLSALAAQWPRMSARWRASGSPLTLPETSPAAASATDGAPRGADTVLCWTITVIMLVCALVEHVLSLLTDLLPVLQCAKQGGAWAVYKSFFVNKFPMVFEVLPFTAACTVPLLYLNLTCTFLWNAIDIVVVVMSSLLAGRLRRFNRFLEKAKGKDLSKFWWQEVRESYNRLALLTKHLDAHISGIVLLSFASNLFFICLQLLHNMTHKSNDMLAPLYFYVSFAWLLARVAVVSMSAANVYEQSTGPLEVLHCVPSKSFCVEVQRFLVQVTTDTVALTGCRFFWVTRSLILTLVGTVATYEIVLVQFHAGKDKPEEQVAACSE